MKNTMKRLLSLALIVLTLSITVQLPTAQAASVDGNSVAAIANGEAQGTGGSKYRTWFYGYDRNVAWCAIFVSWCANQAGASSAIPSSASVSVMRTRTLNNGGTVVSTPQAGDLVFYCNNANGIWCHVGLMTGSRTSVQGNLRNQVLHVAKPQDYRLSGGSTAYTIQYVRPNYSNKIIDTGTTISAAVNTGSADTITETSAILRGSFQVINGRASECGMYLGTSANDTPWLGSDTVNTTGTSMFYSTSKYGRTLQPGTTYWYKAYAIVNGTKYCGELKSFTTSGTAPVEGNLSISKSHMTMKVGTCNQITVTTTPAGQPVSWESTNPDVATVSNGVVTANKPGTTTINVSMNYGGTSYLSLCSVTVEAAAPAVEGNLSINKSHMTIKVGTCDQITATTTPAGQAVSWESTNPDVATVSNGVVTANKPGTTTINVSMNYGGTYYLSLCSVTVETAAPPVESTPAVDLSVSGVTNLSQNSARVNASCSYSNGDRPSAVGLYLGTSSSAMSFYKSDEGINHNKNPFDIWYNLSGLSAGTTYYYQFYATVGNKTVWSSVNSFTTTAAPVQVSNTRSAVVVNTNGQYLAINNAPAASPKYSQQIGRIPPGGTVTVYPDKTSGNWYYVEYNGVSGYAYNKYLALQ